MIQPSLALRGFTPEEKAANEQGVGSLGYLYDDMFSRQPLAFKICDVAVHGCGMVCEYCGSRGGNAVFLIIDRPDSFAEVICLDCLDEDDKTDLVWTQVNRSQKRTAVNPETGEEIATAWDEDGQPQ